MSRLIRPVLTIAAAMLVIGCASLAPPIRLEAPPATLEALVGEWYGEYVTDGHNLNGRRGTIAFNLAAGDDHAHGDVLMIPNGSTRGYVGAFGNEPWVPARPASRGSRVLTIRFVRASDGFLDGQLDPYWDPDRDCVATTTFRGTLGDGVIAGTFRTTFFTWQDVVVGRWKVTRIDHDSADDWRGDCLLTSRVAGSEDSASIPKPAGIPTGCR